MQMTGYSRGTGINDSSDYLEGYSRYLFSMIFAYVVNEHQRIFEVMT